VRRGDERDAWSTAPDTDLDSDNTVIIAFAAASQEAAFDELRSAFPRSIITGCSTAGEIHGASVLDESVAAVVIRFASTPIRLATTPVAKNESFAAGQALGRTVAASDLKAVFVLSDGLVVNGSELARGVNSVVSPGVIVTGGLAGDGTRFARTWVLDENAKPQSEIASAVGLYGDRVVVRHGSKGGWDSFGPERRVTRAIGNVLFELDGRPALELYKSYLGDRASGLPATALLFPLAIRSEQDERRLVRTVLSVDEASQSLTFAGDIAQGGYAQLMRANFDRLVQGASEAGHAASAEGPVVNLAISCVGRRLVLGQRTEEETEAALGALAPGSEQIGYYSYGELSPHVHGAPCELHNQTMTMTSVVER
jgi:hypothetical protein